MMVTGSAATLKLAEQVCPAWLKDGILPAADCGGKCSRVYGDVSKVHR